MGLDSCLGLQRASGRKGHPASRRTNGICHQGSIPGLARQPCCHSGRDRDGQEVYSRDSLSPTLTRLPVVRADSNPLLSNACCLVVSWRHLPRSEGRSSSSHWMGPCRDPAW